MKRTLRPTNAKRVISTAGDKNVKDCSKKKEPSTAPVNFRQPVANHIMPCKYLVESFLFHQWQPVANHIMPCKYLVESFLFHQWQPVEKQIVMPITEDVQKVTEEGGSCLDTNSYVMLHQIKSDLNILLKMMQQNEMQCINDNIIFDGPEKTVEIISGVSQNTNKKDTNKFQETTISRNKSIHQNKITNNPTVKSQNIKPKAATGMYRQNIKPNNVEGRKAARKSRLAIYPCFNISIDSTSESETGIVSESNKVQKLTSFWNDRTKNYTDINLDLPKTPDKIIDGLEYAFELRKKLNEELLSRSSLSSLQSRPWQRTMPVDVHESLFSSSNQKLAPTLGISDLNHKTFFKPESKTSKDMSTNTECMESMLSQKEMKVTNIKKDDGCMKIIINLIGDYGKQISTLVNVDEKIEGINENKGIDINLKESSGISIIDQNYIDPVFMDCDLGSIKKEINLSKKYSGHSLCVQKEDETNKVSDFLCQELSSNFENTTVVGNKTETLNPFDILHSTLPTEYSTERRPSNQSFKIVGKDDEVSILNVEEKNVCDVEKSAYFGCGDSSFDHLYTQSSSLKVNFSIFSDDKVEQSDCNVYSNTGFENKLNQLNIHKDETKDSEVSKNAPINNTMENKSDETIIHDLKSLRVKTMKIDETMGSENRDLTLKENFNEDLTHVQINEENEKFNDDNHQEYLNEINQTNLLEESTLYYQVDKKSGNINILENKLLQEDSHCLQTFCNETNDHVETDNPVIHDIDKTNGEFKDHEDNLKICQEMLTKTTSICLNKSAFNNPLMKSFLDHVIKDLCDSNNFEYIWQKYQKDGFQFISERDILYLALCHPVVQKWNCLMEETSPFNEIKRKCMHCKSYTSTNCLQKFRNIIKLIIPNDWVEVVILQCYCNFRYFTTKKAASFIYHFALSLTIFYIIEEELLGFFSNSKLVYPF